MWNKNRSTLANQAWTLLRLALLWARKGGAFKRSLAATHDSIQYGERELSFDETPIFQFKLRKRGSMRLKCLPRIPCINPLTEFEEEDEMYGEGRRFNSFFRSDADEDSDCWGDCKEVNEARCEADEGIDSKADEFISRFYKEMKLQRQVSYLQYSEMLSRGTS